MMPGNSRNIPNEPNGKPAKRAGKITLPEPSQVTELDPVAVIMRQTRGTLGWAHKLEF